MPSAIVIGAGPAGSVAAFVLANAGWDVTIVEQHRFPRDKVCGECISALGIACLKRLGLSTAVSRCGPIQLRSTILHTTSGRAVHVELPHPMWGLSRGALDAALLDAARGAAARVCSLGARFEGFDKKAVRVRDLESNAVRTIRSDHVIIADGKPPKHRWHDFGHQSRTSSRGFTPHPMQSNCSAAKVSTAASPPSKATAGTSLSAFPPSGCTNSAAIWMRCSARFEWRIRR